MRQVVVPSRRKPVSVLRICLAGAPLVYVVLLTAIELLTRGQYHLIALFAVAVAFAGATCTVPMTGFILAVTLAAATAMLILYGSGTSHSWALLLAVFMVSAVAIIGSRLREVGRTKLKRARSIAAIAQSAILRPLRRRVGDVQVVSTYLAAEQEATVGGDLYEGIDTPFGARLIIGDVRGKGLPAVATAAAALGAFRVMAFETSDLGTLADRLDQHLTAASEQIPVEERELRFITALLVEIPSDQPIARLVSCGHPPPLLAPREGTPYLVRIDDPSPPLNLGHLLTPEEPSRVVTVPFPQGDRMLLYTDGVTEARNLAGDFYPLERRFPVAIAGEEALLIALGEDLAHYAGGLRDDAAMVLAHRVSRDAPRAAVQWTE